MTTTELIKLLAQNEKGGISHKSREISLTINGKYMPNPQITLSSTGDGICGAEIDLDVCGEWLEQEPCEDCISREAVDALVDELARAICDERGHMSRGRDTTSIMQDILDLSSVQPQTRWIPVSERLPEETFGCIVTVWDTNPMTMNEFENILPYFVGWDGEQWNDADGEQCPFEVIAWMPLPEPYKAERSEGE